MANVTKNENGNVVENILDYKFRLSGREFAYVYLEDDKTLHKATIEQSTLYLPTRKIEIVVSIEGKTYVFENYDNFYADEASFKDGNVLQVSYTTVREFLGSKVRNVKFDDRGCFIWFFNEETGRADKWYLLDYITEITLKGYKASFNAHIPCSYCNSSDVYLYNNYVTEEDGKRTKHVAPYGLLMPDADQQALIDELGNLLKKMYDSKIMLRYDQINYNGLLAFNGRNLHDFGWDCDDSDDDNPSFCFDTRFLPLFSEISDINEDFRFQISKDKLNVPLD